MLIHIVLLEPDGPDGLAQVQDAMPILAQVCEGLPGAWGFTHGPNRDFEGKSQRYAYGFELRFADRDAAHAYAAHPDHVRAGGMLVAACKGGHDGIFVADLEV